MLDILKTPLSESVLQKCYKSKTYVRNTQFDLLWHLGGKNNVTIGEKSGKFYLVPAEKNKTLVEKLPLGMIQVPYIPELHAPTPLTSLGDLIRVFPELSEILKKHRK